LITFLFLDKVRDGLGDKKGEFISLICRILGGLIFAFTRGKFQQIYVIKYTFSFCFKGWKLALVFVALSPLTIAAFNITMRVR
jgi:Na+-transporting NADH:ubiquinone oxidoreductase subunit NqrE